MSGYYGDYQSGSTVVIGFETNDKDGGAVAPSDAFEAADIAIYKDGGTTQRSSAAGLTMSSPFDSVVGQHQLTIDLADDTDAGFYAAGADFRVVMQPDETVDSETVVATIGTFSIENRSQPTTASGGTGATNYAITDDNYDGALTYGGVKVGTQTGTFANLSGDNTTFHQMTGTSTAVNIVYYTNVGGNHEAVNVIWQGYLNSGNDEVEIQVYNFSTPGWDTLYTIDGKNNDNMVVEPPLRLTSSHTGTTTELGDVYIRFTATGQTNPTLYNAVLLVSAVSTASNVGYADGAYWIKAAGTSGTEFNTNGTATNPCPWADAVTMNSSTPLNRFRINNGETVTLTGTSDNYTLIGKNWTLDLSDESIDNMAVTGAHVIGTGTATATNQPHWDDCYFGAATIPPSMLERCGIGENSGTLTMTTAGQIVFHECYSMVPGSGTPVLDFDAVGGTTGINNRGWTGGSSYLLNAYCTVSHEPLAGGGQSFTSAGASIELRGTYRAATFTLSSGGVSPKIQAVGTTGPITISGDGQGSSDDTEINLYGVSSALADTSTNTAVSDYTVNNQQRQALFANDTVYVDTVDGTASTVWPYGTPTYPTSTMANGLTIADANTLQQINVRGAVTLGAALEGYSLRGYGQYDIAQVFNVSDESIERSTFASMLISGATGSAALVTDQTRYQDCYLLTHSEINGAMLECAIDGATSVITAGHAWFRNCHFGLKTACVLTVNSPSTCEIENPTGDVTLATMVGGTVNIYCTKAFGVTINSTCTAGTINLYGPVTVTDNSGAGCTVNLYPDAANVTQVDGTAVEADGGNLKVVGITGNELAEKRTTFRT